MRKNPTITESKLNLTDLNRKYTLVYRPNSFQMLSLEI